MCVSDSNPQVSDGLKAVVSDEIKRQRKQSHFLFDFLRLLNALIALFVRKKPVVQAEQQAYRHPWCGR